MSSPSISLPVAGSANDQVSSRARVRPWRWREYLPAVLSIGLLLFQCALPWTAHHFVTQDGPAHLYNGVVARSLWLDPHSPYATIYQFQEQFVPNWGTTALLAVAATLFGVTHAEQGLMTLLVLAGYFAFGYAARALQPSGQRRIVLWSPLVNCLWASYFLYKGFYNLYLGMALLLVATGYYLRHARDFSVRRAVVLGTGLVGLYLVHLIPVSLAMLTVGLLGVWGEIVVPLVQDRRNWKSILRQAWTPLSRLSFAFTPTVLMLATFAHGTDAGQFPTEAEMAWHEFPMHVFVISANRIGRLELLYPAVLCYIVMGILLMRRREWLSMRGGLVLALAAIFLMYLYVPNAGFGGSEVKVRFAWAIFLLGGLVATTVARLRTIRFAFSLFVCFLLTGSLVTTRAINARASRMVDAYLETMKDIPANASVVRVRYPIRNARLQFDVPFDLPSDPLYHMESFAAAQRHAVSLSDYEAPSGVFPVVFRTGFPAELQSALWGMENGEPDGSVRLRGILEHPAVKVDYVVVQGELSAPGANDLRATLTMLESKGMKLVATAGVEPFVRVYRRE